ncbi:hypothetical protein [Thalassospira indica]|uniref:hypothetical protein n=1 Tax=Thalassospira indica TaxID=1891279 RepID=UPI001013C428|nr:hypothetical protein [Thalassospira indica]
MVRGAVYIKTTQLRQVFFDRFLKKNARKCFAGLIGKKAAQKQKKRQRKNRGAYFVHHSQSGREWRE